MIAAVEGWALAGGLELMLACDLIVAARSAQLGVPEVTRGLVASGGGALLLAERVATATALELILIGRPIGADRAAELGLINKVVDDGAALSGALELARVIAAYGPFAAAAFAEKRAPRWTGR